MVAGVSVSVYFYCSELGGVKWQVFADCVGLGFDLGIGDTLGGSLGCDVFLPLPPPRKWGSWPDWNWGGDDLHRLTPGGET
jgi:hypothetical protein